MTNPNLETLNLLSLQVLARRALDESIPIVARLAYSEALNARLPEAENAWSGYSDHARVQILAALALDLSAAGFVTIPGETPEQVISDYQNHIAREAKPEPTPEPEAKPESDALAQVYSDMSHASHDSYIADLTKPEPEAKPESGSFVDVCRKARERIYNAAKPEPTPEPTPARLNDILSTKEILHIIAAMKTAADCYEAEANRTPLMDIRRELVSRTKVTRAIAGRFQNLAKV